MTRARRGVGAVIIDVLTYLAVIFFISPFLWMILTSFKTEIQAYLLPPLLIFKPTFSHYLSVFYSSNFWFYFVNSVWAAAGSAIISIVLGTMAGFAMTQMARKSASNVMFFILSTRFMPAAAVVVPLYIFFLQLHLLDTHWALIIAYTALDLPIVTWMARSYFADIPAEIFESARVDGASTWETLFQVGLPLARPGLWAAGLLAVVFSWNEFFFAVNFTYTQAPTLPVLVSSFMTTQGLYWARLSALDTVVVALPVILGLIAQRHLVRGLTAGAVK